MEGTRVRTRHCFTMIYFLDSGDKEGDICIFRSASKLHSEKRNNENRIRTFAMSFLLLYTRISVIFFCLQA